MNRTRPAHPRVHLERPSPDLSGWFCVAFAADLQATSVLPVRFFGNEYALMRTEGGTIAMLDAHCPHLGAHMGHGGTVQGEQLVCPFHGFRFQTDGRCVGTDYDNAAPHNADLGAVHVEVRGGLVFAWHHPSGEPPSWSLPDWSQTGFSGVRGHHTVVATHPQETSENSVDFGHFSRVHGYTDVKIARDVEVTGEHLSITYQMKRVAPGIPFLRIPVEFHVDVWGLGLSIVSFRVLGMPLRMRLFILATLRDPDTIDLRAATQVAIQGGRGIQMLSALSRRVINELLLVTVLKDVEQDRTLWENKRYESRPRIAKGDGPIGRYRAYVRQFYPLAS